MEKKHIILTIIALTVCGGFFLLGGLFGKQRSTPSKDYETIQRLYDERIADLKERITSEAEFRKTQTEQFEGFMQRDSLYRQMFIDNQNKYIPVTNKAKDAQNRIDRITNNDDSIRAAFAED